MTTEQFRPFDVEPPPGTKSATTPREIKTNLNDVENAEDYEKKPRRLPAWAWSLIGLVALASIGAVSAGAYVAVKNNEAS